MKIKLLLATVLLFFFFCTPNTRASQWSQLGGPYGAWVPQMAVSNGYIYISCELNQSYGGIHRSNNNGTSWTDISVGLPIPRAQSIAAVGNTVYVCCDTSIFVSTNNGNNWTDISSNLADGTFPMEVFLHNGILFAAIYFGNGSQELFYSTNNGASWTTTGFSLGASGVFNAFTSDGNKLYASTTNYGIQVSTNNGFTWTSMSNNIPFNASIYTIAAHGDTLYAGTSYGVYISTDGANLWMPANNGFPASTPNVACFTIFNNVVYTGTFDYGVYSTPLGGTTWTAAGTGLVPYTIAFQLAVNGNTLITGGNNGIYVTTIPASNWILSNNGLVNAYITTVFADGLKVFANVGSYVGLQFSNDGGNTWIPTNLTTNNYAKKIIKHNNTYYAVTGLGIYVSTNGSAWTSSNTGIPPVNGALSILSIGNKLLVGTSGGGVYESTNGGLNWTISSTGLPPNSSITSFAVSGATVYANHSNKGVYVSYNAGATWSVLNNGLPSTAYYSGLEINGNCIFTLNTDGTYRSCNNGASWQKITPSYSVTDLAVKNNLLIGLNYSGVSISDDNGSHWYSWSEGLLQYINQVNKIYVDGNTVYCGSEIGSVWKRSLTPELITTSIGASPYCSGDSITVNFTTTATYNTGNTFYVALSDSSGNFTKRVLIDSLTAVTPSAITAHIPDTIATGSHYRIRVFSTSPYVINTDNGNDIIINQKPAIYLQPANQTTCEGYGSGFFCGAKGSGIAYQWQVDDGSGYVNLTNNATYQNVNSSLLLIINTTALMSGYKYHCIISGTCTPIVTSNFGTLIVITPAPGITAQPTDQTICAQGSTSFSITATGPSLTYKWEQNSGSGFFFPLINGGTYNGVTTPILTINNSSGNMNGYQYRCKLSGCVVSDTATLIVNGLPIAPFVADANVCNGSTAYFSANASGANVSYQWEENNGSGFITITNGGNYTGATGSTLSISNVTPAIDTYQYRCQLTGVCAPFTSQSNDATLTINTNPPVIILQPNDTAVCERSKVKFGLQANTAAAFYNWQINTGSGWTNLIALPPFSGVNNDTLQIDTVGLSFNGYRFRCKVSDCATSDSATLTVNAFPLVTLNPFSSVCIYSSPVVLTGASPGGGNYYGTAISNNQFDPALSGTGVFAIAYLYTSSNGCAAVVSQNITVNTCVNVGVDKLTATVSNFILFPNPAIDYIYVNGNLNENKTHQLIITNILGEIVYEKSFQKTNAIAEKIAASSFENGMYFVTLKTDDTLISKKVVVLH